MKYKNHFQCLIKSAQFIYVLLSKKINPLFSQFKYLASHECSLLRRKPYILSIYISLILSLVFLKPSFPQIIVRQDNFVQPQRATFMNIFCSLTKRRPTKDPTYRQKFTECLQPALTFSFQIRLKTKRIYIYIYTHNEGITLFFLSLESRSQRARQGVVEQDRSPRTRTTECARIYLSLYVTGMLSTLITEACLRVTIFQTRYRVIRLYNGIWWGQAQRGPVRSRSR